MLSILQLAGLSLNFVKLQDTFNEIRCPLQSGSVNVVLHLLEYFLFLLVCVFLGDYTYFLF